jgi:hypothetical protein
MMNEISNYSTSWKSLSSLVFGIKQENVSKEILYGPRERAMFDIAISTRKSLLLEIDGNDRYKLSGINTILQTISSKKKQ